jgi:hypothetical protein
MRCPSREEAVPELADEGGTDEARWVARRRISPMTSSMSAGGGGGTISLGLCWIRSERWRMADGLGILL